MLVAGEAVVHSNKVGEEVVARGPWCGGAPCGAAQLACHFWKGALALGL